MGAKKKGSGSNVPGSPSPSSKGSGPCQSRTLIRGGRCSSSNPQGGWRREASIRGCSDQTGRASRCTSPSRTVHRLPAGKALRLGKRAKPRGGIGVECDERCTKSASSYASCGASSCHEPRCLSVVAEKKINRKLHRYPQCVPSLLRTSVVQFLTVYSCLGRDDTAFGF